jgi:hypothetical protein
VEQLDRHLDATPYLGRAPKVDARAGLVPPAWWQGDEDAALSGLVAAGVWG